LYDFLLLVLGPVIAYIVGDRFSYVILRSMYMMNRSDKHSGDLSESLNDQGQVEAK